MRHCTVDLHHEILAMKLRYCSYRNWCRGQMFSFSAFYIEPVFFFL
jgi:hypothetical protein